MTVFGAAGTQASGTVRLVDGACSAVVFTDQMNCENNYGVWTTLLFVEKDHGSLDFAIGLVRFLAFFEGGIV